MTIEEIAKKKGMNQIERREMWNGYQVYSIYDKRMKGCAVGLPCFVLENHFEVREATPIEVHRILVDRSSNG